MQWDWKFKLKNQKTDKEKGGGMRRILQWCYFEKKLYLLHEYMITYGK